MIASLQNASLVLDYAKRRKPLPNSGWKRRGTYETLY